MRKIVQEIQLTSGDLKRRYSYVRKIIKGHNSLAPPRCRIPSTEKPVLRLKVFAMQSRVTHFHDETKLARYHNYDLIVPATKGKINGVSEMGLYLGLRSWEEQIYYAICHSFVNHSCRFC